MHILHVTPYYAPAHAFGGVTRAVEGMATATAQRGHTVTVLTTDALTQDSRIPASQRESSLDGVHIIRCRNISVWLRGRANLSTPPGMVTEASHFIPQVDVVHCHEFRTLENVLTTPLAARHSKPMVLSPHGTLPHGTGRSTFKQLWDTFIGSGIAKRFNTVISLAAQEQMDAESLWNQFGASSSHEVISNGVNIEQFEKLPPAEHFRVRYSLGTGPVVLFMGRLHPRKGVDVLARAFRNLEMPDARLLVVGPDEGLLPTLQQIATEDSRIVFTGFLTGEERMQAFAAADVFALPAVGEGLPMAVLEAMAAGLPVVISPGCNLPEVAANGAGVEVAVNEHSLTQALRHLVADAQRREAMALAARTLVAQQFTWEAVAAQLDDVYTALLDRN